MLEARLLGRIPVQARGIGRVVDVPPKALETLPRRNPGQTLYQPGKIIGEGNLGSAVLLSRPSGETAVWKTYNKFGTGKSPVEQSPSVMMQLWRAAEAYSKLNHPNIARLYEVLPSGDVVMEHVEGKTLWDRMHEPNKISAPEIITYSVSLLDALDHAHTRGVTHNDVKPRNIMLHEDEMTRRTTVKLIDFDSAYQAGDPLDEILASPAYSPVERIKGGQLTEKGDVYSVAVILYEALAGNKPFQFETIDSLVSKQRKGASSLKRKIGRENMTPLLRQLDPLLIKVLSSDPKDRPTAAQFRDQLLEIAAKHGESIPTDGWAVTQGTHSRGRNGGRHRAARARDRFELQESGDGAASNELTVSLGELTETVVREPEEPTQKARRRRGWGRRKGEKLLGGGHAPEAAGEATINLRALDDAPTGVVRGTELDSFPDLELLVGDQTAKLSLGNEDKPVDEEEQRQRTRVRRAALAAAAGVITVAGLTIPAGASMLTSLLAFL